MLTKDPLNTTCTKIGTCYSSIRSWFLRRRMRRRNSALEQILLAYYARPSGVQ